MNKRSAARAACVAAVALSGLGLTVPAAMADGHTSGQASIQACSASVRAKVNIFVFSQPNPSSRILDTMMEGQLGCKLSTQNGPSYTAQLCGGSSRVWAYVNPSGSTASGWVMNKCLRAA
ncbi:hypothetical protein [Actinomadura rudentiformis]|uniref:SH3 domain-containing protein n=1 Tax=Actinomadura rudentiformis TaxID=359158 RepID=A0A6H9YR69_9ACTN|nr:hypothetical protein [Actinomadura rudentiformis]KAB2343430.1 hypothetical protein F8566_35475 [Actinomadura rudentiformis]